MQRTSILIGTQRGEIVRLEVCSLPRAALKKLRSQIRMLHWDFFCVLGALRNGIGNDLRNSDKLLLLKLRKKFRIGEGLRFLDTSEEIAIGIFRLFVQERNQRIAILLNPLILEAIALSYARNFRAEDTLRPECQHFLHTHSQTVRTGMSLIGMLPASFTAFHTLNS